MGVRFDKETMYLFKVKPQLSANIKVPDTFPGVNKSRLLTSIQYVADYSVVPPIILSRSITLSDCIISGNNMIFNQKIVKKDIPGTGYEGVVEGLTFVKDSKYDILWTDYVYQWNSSTLVFDQKQGPWYILEKGNDSAYNYNKNVTLFNNDYFRFQVNPQNVVRSRAKLLTKNLTSAGWNLQYWGDEIPSLDVRGQTLSILPESGQIVPAADPYSNHPLLESPAYKNLKELEDWYKESNSLRNSVIPQYLVGFNYRGVTYVGFFESFSITDSVDKPYVIEYSFKYSILYEYEGGITFGNIK